MDPARMRELGRFGDTPRTMYLEYFLEEALDAPESFLKAERHFEWLKAKYEEVVPVQEEKILYDEEVIHMSRSEWMEVLQIPSCFDDFLRYDSGTWKDHVSDITMAGTEKLPQQGLPLLERNDSYSGVGVMCLFSLPNMQQLLCTPNGGIGTEEYSLRRGLETLYRKSRVPKPNMVSLTGDWDKLVDGVKGEYNLTSNRKANEEPEEIFLPLLDSLCRKNQDYIDNFRVDIKSLTKGTICGHTVQTVEHDYTLTLKPGGVAGGKALEDCMNNTFAEREMSNWKCSECPITQSATLITAPTHLSSCLIIEIHEKGVGVHGRQTFSLGGLSYSVDAIMTRRATNSDTSEGDKSSGEQKRELFAYLQTQDGGWIHWNPHAGFCAEGFEISLPRKYKFYQDADTKAPEQAAILFCTLIGASMLNNQSQEAQPTEPAPQAEACGVSQAEPEGQVQDMDMSREEENKFHNQPAPQIETYGLLQAEPEAQVQETDLEHVQESQIQVGQSAEPTSLATTAESLRREPDRQVEDRGYLLDLPLYEIPDFSFEIDSDSEEWRNFEWEET